MKTKGMSQQLEALRRMNGRSYYALFMEMGTGKTWTFLADGERAYSAGKIDSMFVVAPNGVHTNWVRREIPIHMNCPYIARAWRAGMSKKAKAHVEELLDPRRIGQQPPLRILTMSFDALRTKDGFDYAWRFMNATRCMMVVDESTRIKNLDAERTKRCLRLAPLAVARRIGSGLPITKNPGDIFAQMEFLQSGLLGTTSYRAFFSEYAVLCDAENPRTDSDWSFKRQVDKNPRMKHALIVARDDVTGLPMYRNLDKLGKLLEPHSYRVLQKDCLDLPPAVYKQINFDLDPKQHAAYTLMENELRILQEDGTLTPVHALAALTKLQQITSGFVKVPGREELLYVSEDNPRLRLLKEVMEDLEGQKVIIWARFREEIAAIVETLREMGRKVVEYHGGVKAKDRDPAIDSFQDGDADTFVGNPQAGGIGLTLTAARFAVYYSNDHNAETRSQSEKRNYRKGTTGTVTYIDLTATDTLDESIARAYQLKLNVASTILGDRNLDFRKAI